MKSLIALALFVSLPAFAQSTPSTPVKITKTKITCFQDSIYSFKSEGEKDFSVPEVDKGKRSESIRTTWSENGTEYRSSEFQGFNDEGKVNAFGNALTKITSTKTGNVLVEESLHTSVTRYTDGRMFAGGTTIRHISQSSRYVYTVNGNERILTEAQVDGKPADTYEQKITSTQNGNTRTDHMVNKTPYTKTQGKFTINTLKDELTCTYEDLN